MANKSECFSMVVFDKNLHVLQICVIDDLADIERVRSGDEHRNAYHHQLML